MGIKSRSLHLRICILPWPLISSPRQNRLFRVNLTRNDEVRLAPRGLPPSRRTTRFARISTAATATATRARSLASMSRPWTAARLNKFRRRSRRPSAGPRPRVIWGLRRSPHRRAKSAPRPRASITSKGDTRSPVQGPRGSGTREAPGGLPGARLHLRAAMGRPRRPVALGDDPQDRARPRLWSPRSRSRSTRPSRRSQVAPPTAPTAQQILPLDRAQGGMATRAHVEHACLV